MERKNSISDQSSGQNPIEHFWEKFKRRVRKYKILSKESLKGTLSWEKFSEIFYRCNKTLCDTMSRRLQAVHEAKWDLR